MPSRTAAVTAVAILTILSRGGAGQSRVDPSTGRLTEDPPPSRAPLVVPAVHYDVSPPLRSMPALRPTTDANREVKEPGPMRRALGRSVQRMRVDTAVQDTPRTPLMPLPSMTFEGIDNANGVLPPDTNGDVGPNHYVQWVNLQFAVWTKGTPTTPPALVYGPVAGNTLWRGFGGPCESRNDGDPIVMYDHLADRWFLSQLAVPNAFFGFLFGPFYQCIAVSATPDPAGAYYRYQFQFNKLNDYPKFGLWPDAYYLAINQYNPFYLSYGGQGVIAFDRQKMLSGLPASMIYFDLAAVDINLGGMLPAHLTGAAPPAGSPEYFAQVDDDAWGYSPDQLQIWQFHTDWANPSKSTFSKPALLPVAPFDSTLCGVGQLCVPQPGTTAVLDPLSDRLMYRLNYRNLGSYESLVVNHTVDADGSDHAGIRWYEIRSPGAAPFIYQQGTYAPDADHRWMGSAAIDRVGNIALGFSVSGATTSPSIRYTGRLAGDEPGVMTQGEADLMVGAGSQTHESGRWGDYSLLAIDPVDQCTFWYTQEYYAATSPAGWQTRVGSFAFPSCQGAPDVTQVTIAATTPRATEAGPTNGVFTIARTGDLTAPLDVHFTIAGTATPGVDYVALPSSITLAAGQAAATLAVVPIDDLLIEPDETVSLSLVADPSYRGGSPSSAVITIVSDDVPPDLVMISVVGPDVTGAGATISVTDTTKNQSGGPSAASTTYLYLSTNAVLDNGDVLVGTRAVPALAAGGSSTGSTPVTIPAGTASGLYYIVAKADGPNAIAESQEGNNTRQSGLLRLGPDLSISAISAPATAGAGDTLNLSDTTWNQGGGDAGASKTAFYLTTNGFINASTVTLGSRDVPPLAAGASSMVSTPVVLPPGLAPGLYYVVAIADQPNAVVESQETNNNRTSGAINIGPDLAVTGVSAPSVAGAGSPLPITETTKNQGGGSTAIPSTTAFYLSTDTVIGPGDVMLGGRTVPVLASGGSDGATTPVMIPTDTPTGTYYVLVKADANNQVAETYETNNVGLAYVRIGPDLTVTAPSITGGATSGASITATVTVRNSGGGTAAASTTRFYLSTNLYLDAPDILLATIDVPALDAGASNTATATCTIPIGTTPGTYYLIAVADGANVVPETSEANNLGITYLRVN